MVLPAIRGSSNTCSVTSAMPKCWLIFLILHSVLTLSNGATQGIFSLLDLSDNGTDTTSFSFTTETVTSSTIVDNHLEENSSHLLQIILNKSETIEKLTPNDFSSSQPEFPKKNESLDEFFPFELFVSQPEEITMLENAIESLSGAACKEHTRRIINGLIDRERWALKMYDASAKQAQGVLSGSTYQLGNFDECINVESYAGNVLEPLFRGQYCLLEVDTFFQSNSTSIYDRGANEDLLLSTYKKRKLPPSTLHWAVCVPSTCSSSDVQQFIRTILTSYFDRKLEISLTKRMCHVKREIPVSRLDIVYGCVVISFVLVTLLGTIFHLVRIYSKPKKRENYSIIDEVVVSFSLIQNLKKVLNVKQVNEQQLDFISGIRSIAMSLIIAGHSLIFTVTGPVLNEEFFREATRNVENALFLNNPLLVDTFLLFSGFLMCLMLMIELDKRKGRINFLFVYIGRFLRLTPSYLVVIGFYCTWMIRAGSGPLWNQKMGIEKDRCLTSWWTNILYINNYVNTDQMCMFQSWYLSVDTQLFILAPFVIYPLWKWPRIGVTALSFSIITSVTTPFVVTYLQQLDPTLMIFIPEVGDFQTNDYFITAYIKTHMRATSYCFGLMFGYLVYKIQKSEKPMFQISQTLLVFSWIVSFILGCASLFGVTYFYRLDVGPTPLVSAAYNGLHRVGWSLAIGCLILSCTSNKAGVINRFLSWKLFQPIARLTYCAYLVNGLVVIYGLAVERQPIYMSIYELFCRSFSHIAISFTLALILCVIFESPIHGIERILLRIGQKRKPRLESDESNNS